MASCSVAGIAVRQGLVLLGRRIPGGELGGRWEFPGGKVEVGETAEAALAREYREELGVEIRVCARLGEGSFMHHGRRYSLEAFEIEVLGELGAHPEHEELRWVPRAQLGAYDLAESDRGLLPLIAGALVSGT